MENRALQNSSSRTFHDTPAGFQVTGLSFVCHGGGAVHARVTRVVCQLNSNSDCCGERRCWMRRSQRPRLLQHSESWFSSSSRSDPALTPLLAFAVYRWRANDIEDRRSGPTDRLYRVTLDGLRSAFACVRVARRLERAPSRVASAIRVQSSVLLRGQRRCGYHALRPNCRSFAGKLKHALGCWTCCPMRSSCSSTFTSRVPAPSLQPERSGGTDGKTESSRETNPEDSIKTRTDRHRHR